MAGVKIAAAVVVVVCNADYVEVVGGHYMAGFAVGWAGCLGQGAELD
jgi:hypothetical protein